MQFNRIGLYAVMHMYSGDKILPFLTEMKWLGFAICLLLCTSTFLKPILSRWCSSIPYKVILMDENLEMLYVIVSKYLLQTQTDCIEMIVFYVIALKLDWLAFITFSLGFWKFYCKFLGKYFLLLNFCKIMPTQLCKHPCLL